MLVGVTLGVTVKVALGVGLMGDGVVGIGVTVGGRVTVRDGVNVGLSGKITSSELSVGC